MSSLSENKTQEVPNDFTSLMVILSKYDLIDEANKIVEKHQDNEKRITELQKLIMTAEERLDKRLGKITLQVTSRVDFGRLRSILRIGDVLVRRQKMIELLEDHEIDYKRL